MTTSVSIVNNGPDKVTIVPVDDNGTAQESGRVVLAPSERVDFLVYGNQNVHIAEVKAEVKKPEPPPVESESSDDQSGDQAAA